MTQTQLLPVISAIYLVLKDVFQRKNLCSKPRIVKQLRPFCKDKILWIITAVAAEYLD